MNYNLNKTKTVDKETIKHLMTVLYCLFSNADDYQEEAKKYFEKDKKYSNEMYKKSYKKWDEAENYLKSYIKELFKQNKI